MSLDTELDKRWISLSELVVSTLGEQQRRIGELLNYPAERNVDLWIDAGANPELTVDDFERVVVVQRGEDWTGMFAAMVAAAMQQAAFELMIFDALEQSRDASQAVQRMVKGMSRSKLQDVAVAGFDGTAGEKKQTG